MSERQSNVIVERTEESNRPTEGLGELQEMIVSSAPLALLAALVFGKALVKFLIERYSH